MKIYQILQNTLNMISKMKYKIAYLIMFNCMC
jgi:hypothetical protein